MSTTTAGHIGGKAPPPAVKPRPKANGDVPKAAPPPVKKKPVATPQLSNSYSAPPPAVAPRQATPPSAGSPDSAASPSKRPKPPPPTRHQSLAIGPDEFHNHSPSRTLSSSGGTVSVKQAAEMVLSESGFPPPPPPCALEPTPELDDFPSPPPAAKAPPVVSPRPSIDSGVSRPRADSSATSVPALDVAPRSHRSRSHTNPVSMEPPNLPPLQSSLRQPSVDEAKYNEIESLLSGFMLDLDDKDFFSKAMEELSDDVSTV